MKPNLDSVEGSAEGNRVGGSAWGSSGIWGGTRLGLLLTFGPRIRTEIGRVGSESGPWKFLRCRERWYDLKSSFCKKSKLSGNDSYNLICESLSRRKEVGMNKYPKFVLQRWLRCNIEIGSRLSGSRLSWFRNNWYFGLIVYLIKVAGQYSHLNFRSAPCSRTMCDSYGSFNRVLF